MTSHAGIRYVLMAGILNDQPNVLVVSKFDSRHHICGRADVNRIIHDVSKRALCRLGCIRAARII